ncbi:MAG: hypothetical protein K2O78_05690 [Muribaculaceae bacterium]|nr:hypothetical protein [Muribaculaceae bacterium]MDE7081124.1 hypothetical protein [Muribaculaceae bacterium]
MFLLFFGAVFVKNTLSAGYTGSILCYINKGEAAFYRSAWLFLCAAGMAVISGRT